MAKEKSNIIYGIHPIIEAFEAGKVLEKIYVLNGSNGANTEKIKSLAKDSGTPINYVPIFKLNKITSNNHQGVIAVGSPIEYHSLQEVVQSSFEKGKDPFVILLDRITDVRNIGAITRSANAFGVDAIVVPLSLIHI